MPQIFEVLKDRGFKVDWTDFRAFRALVKARFAQALENREPHMASCL
jgi:hypothetical protein